MEGVEVEFCRVRPNGVVEFSPAGVDIMKAMLMRWIIQAEKGERAARAMSQFGDPAMVSGQLKYWKGCIGFLTQRLCSQMGQRQPLKEELEWAARCSLEGAPPAHWLPYLKASAEVGDDGNDVSDDGGGSGAGGVGNARRGTKHPKRSKSSVN